MLFKGHRCRPKSRPYSTRPHDPGARPGDELVEACIFAAPATLLGSASVPVSHHFGPGGEATQDPDELVESCRTAARQALAAAGVHPGELEGRGTSQPGRILHRLR